MLSVALSALLGAGAASAFSIPFERRAPPHGTLVRIAPTTNVTGDDPFGFQSINGNAYTGTIFISGQPFIVQLDTGSSDLWVDTSNTSLSGLTDTGIQGSVAYVDGTGAFGNIALGSVTWGDFTVQKQAFINAPGANATNGGEFQGLLGVGPPALSNIEGLLNGSQYDGSTFLDNVFSLYPNEPNFMTFLLTRTDSGVVDGGVFTIGELAPNYTAINDQPKLNVVTSDTWGTFLDGVLVNGTLVSGGALGGSSVTPPGNTTLAILDTGTSLITAPPLYVDAIYGSIPEAIFQDGSYIYPCDYKANVSFVFGNATYAINPIDLGLPAVLSTDGSIVGCLSTFSYTPDGAGVDFILGDRFLRNVYSLYDFGSWARVGDTPPFMQILSTTDEGQAWAEFDTINKAREDAFKSGTPVSTDAPSPTESPSVATPTPAVASPTPVPTVDAQGSSSVAAAAPVSTSAGGAGTTDKDLQVHAAAASADDTSSVDWSALNRNLYIIIGLLGAVIALLIGLIAKTCFGSRPAMGSGKASYRSMQDPFPPQHDKPYTSDAYSTPYADGGH